MTITIGLLGVGNDGTLYAPNGRRLVRLPLAVAAAVQAAWMRVVARPRPRRAGGR
ncbi:MAG: hypothetical protein IT374_26130 [Polyangiaceae bacterium]|nr:hypothetical protein [Polyangiaceae bacterium]